ncbi:MAG TPA: phosphoribosyltransferase family protein, partial [Rhodocyclaceae bacterium]|nr:phosphoribosyltransferase family protein [Rhodocyclaceae bacterium]
FPVEGANIVIVDDVLYTGRTTRAALNELFDYGRPARVDLAVLVDRGGRELPIGARYCAYTLPDPLPASQTLELEHDDAGRLSLRLIDA